MKTMIKKGDNVLVISGKDKNKTGKVLEVSRNDGKIIVEGINIVTKHVKPKSQQEKGGIVKKPAMFDASNVMIICPKCEKATRVSHSEVDGKKSRICKKCSASLDVKFEKEAKKATKSTEKPKAEKAEKKPAKTVKKSKVEKVESAQGEDK